MRTISGRVTSSKPISLFKATSVLTTFVAAEAGASQAMAAYLRRTVEAFNELTQLHKELKGSKFGRKHKRAKEHHENHRLPETTNEHDIEKSAKENYKKKKKKEREEMSSLESEEEMKEEKKKKKKRKNPDVEEGGIEHSEEQRSKKKRKKSD